MKIAIFTNLDVLLSHISQELIWNGVNETQIMHDKENETVAVICDPNVELLYKIEKSSVWFNGKQLTEYLINPEDSIYITQAQNIHDYVFDNDLFKEYLAIVDFDTDLDIAQLINSSNLSLMHKLVVE